ncbi:MerR family transcriptional regulator [Planococcus beigongshangi]|uniref:MerR family transcriptional regulator n=1 Tax=Planococcus beigongshangi TaxID=2782536 RepID=UPI00193B5D5E|nr:MerR family transcriptional regulator [Planococcus beigongshangi]
MYKVQEVATIAGVSVRTLHHYDSIGLMKPSNIGSNRYRYYNDDDLKLLQHILFFKELGFSLKKIQELVAEGFDAAYALSQHAELLRQKKERIEKLIENAEMTQLEYADAREVSNVERFAAFGIKQTDDNIKMYLDVPEQSAAGDEEAYEDFSEPDEVLEEVNFTEPEPEAEQEIPVNDGAASAKPEKEEEDLEEINREGERIYNAVSNLMHLPPASPEVQVEMKAYYTLLDRFYNCSPKMFRGLGDLYATDSRFAKNIDRHGAGLSEYLKDAMYIFADGLADA